MGDAAEKEALTMKPSLAFPEFEKLKLKEQEGFIVMLWAEPSAEKLDGLGEQPLTVTVAEEAPFTIVILMG
jgi:hypothetical protein